jgi:hypothetical protein
MTMRTRINSTINAANVASRTVWLFVLIEILASVALAVLVCVAAIRLGHSVAFDDLPPWRALATFPAVGAAAGTLRVLRPGEVLRRWHGIAVRRIDERWGDER